MTTRTRRLVRISVTLTALCILGCAVLSPSVGASAATLPDAATAAGTTTAGPADSGTAMLATTGTWEVSRDDHPTRGPMLRVGDRVHGVVAVTNTVGIPVAGLTLVGTGTEATCGTSTLAPGATTTCVTADRRIDHVDAEIGAVTLSVRAAAFTPEGLLVRSTPSDLTEWTVGTAAGQPARTSAVDRTVAAIGAGGVLATLAAVTGAVAGCLGAARRLRPATSR